MIYSPRSRDEKRAEPRRKKHRGKTATRRERSGTRISFGSLSQARRGRPGALTYWDSFLGGGGSGGGFDLKKYSARPGTKNTGAADP